MIATLSNHLWQSTLFAVAAALLSIAFRRNRAHVRHWLWLSASVKFLLPFSLLMNLGGHLGLEPPAKQIAAPAITVTVTQFSQPFAEIPPAASIAMDRDWTGLWLAAAWAFGFAAIVVIRFRGWLRVRAALRASEPIDLPAPIAIRSSPGLLEPGVVGWLRPVLLVPEGITERLTPRQFEAVLAHELCHVRRRDNLASSIHMVVEALFWFHPLVWWIGARLLEERERACDEAVLSLGGEARDYAEGIVNVCKLYVESPVACVAGVTGSNLRKRIEAIMKNPDVLRLSLARKAVLAGAGLAAVAVPVVIGIWNAPASRAQSQVPGFASVSIAAGCSDGAPRKDGTKGGGNGGPPQAGMVNDCSTVVNMVRHAWFQYTSANPEHFVTHVPVPVEGGPDWTRTEHYQIHARAEGTPGYGMTNGPMLQALLADRFKLQVHSETREVPVYALSVAPGGPTLQAFQEGSCTPSPELWTSPAPGDNRCQIREALKGSNLTIDLPGFTLDAFCRFLRASMDRPVINRTGIAGKYNLHLEIAPDPTSPGFGVSLARQLRVSGLTPSTPNGQSIYTAVQQQLGLRLDPVMGSSQTLVIDHVERPALN